MGKINRRRPTGQNQSPPASASIAGAQREHSGSPARGLSIKATAYRRLEGNIFKEKRHAMKNKASAARGGYLSSRRLRLFFSKKEEEDAETPMAATQNTPMAAASERVRLELQPEPRWIFDADPD